MLLEFLPQRIKNLRESAGLGQLELAKMAGITQAQVSNYEVGKQFPGLETAAKLAAAFGITVADLIGEADPKPGAPRPPRKEEMAIWVLEAIGISQVRVDQIRRVLGEADRY